MDVLPVDQTNEVKICSGRSWRSKNITHIAQYIIYLCEWIPSFTYYYGGTYIQNLNKKTAFPLFFISLSFDLCALYGSSNSAVVNGSSTLFNFCCWVDDDDDDDGWLQDEICIHSVAKSVKD